MWYHVYDYYFKNEFGYSGNEDFCRKLALYGIRGFYPVESYDLKVIRERGGIAVEVCKKSWIKRCVSKLRRIFRKGGAR